MLLPFYVVQVALVHPPCTTHTGHNVSKSYDYSFKLGLVILVIDVVNTHANGLYLFHADKMESRMPNGNWSMTHKLLNYTGYIEFIMWGATIVVSIKQAVLNLSSNGSYCVNHVLIKERDQMTILIILQVVKAIAFGAFSTRLDTQF